MEFLNLKNQKKKLVKISRFLIEWDKTSRSVFQKQVKDFLKIYWISDLVFEELPLVGLGRMTLDFYNHSKKIALEANGAQHWALNSKFHGEGKLAKQKFLEQMQRDELKMKWCEINQIKFINLDYDDWILAKTQESRKKLLQTLELLP